MLNVSNPIINKTPISPTKIEINLIKVKLSSFVKKGDKIIVKIGATESNNAVVFDCIDCSAQLIKNNGKIFPIIPIKIINK